MYHIKHDKRSQRSAQLITDAMMEILASKAFGDITISDIERTSHVARSTFYRLFDNTVDVLAYKCDLVFYDLNEIHARSRDATVDEVMVLTGAYWMRNTDILEALERSGHQNVLLDSFERNLPRAAENFLGEDERRTISNPYMASIISAVISASLITWVRYGKKESASELWGRIKETYRSISFLVS